VFHSAVARYYAPSDLCGAGGMHCERIRSNSQWRGQYARYDTVLVQTDPNKPGMRGMTVARVFLFFSFKWEDRLFPCALVHWYDVAENQPNHVTEIWVVRPQFEANRRRKMAVIHIDCILRGVHLIGVYGKEFLPSDFKFTFSLDACESFYVNPYADHHSYEVIV
jgi:hypothetical protein